MAANFVQAGNCVTVISPAGGVSSGDLVVIDALVGVALHDAAAGADLELGISGVFTLSKGAETIAQGAPVYESSGDVTGTAGTDKEVGIALEDAGIGVFTIDVLLVNTVRDDITA